MAKVEDCPGFETFGADVKAAREAKRLARKTLAEMVGIEWLILSILVDTFISKISFPMQPGPEIGSISDA